MMERYTIITDGYYAVDNDVCFEDQNERYCGPAVERLAEYEDTGLTPEEVVKMGMAYEYSKRYSGRLEGKLKAYEKAETEGRLVVLPCKVGDTVYAIATPCGGCPCFNEPMYEEFIEKCRNCGRKEIIEVEYDYEIICEFGKTVFLTREEAEAALAKERA